MIDRAPARILITGANGFVGRHAIPALRARFPKAWLLGATQHAEATSPGLDEALVMDLLDAASIDAAIATGKPDAVLHLAAQAAVGESFTAPLMTWRVNLLGTLALAEAVLRQRPSAYFLYVSSAEVYGLSFQTGQPLSEAALVVAAFARQVARIEAGLQPPVIRTGALNRWRDMLDVRDVAAAYAEAIARAHSLDPGIVINLASGRPRCIGDILQTLIAGARTKMVTETDQGRLRPTDIEKTLGDSSRAAALLDWSPQIAWETSLHDVMEYWRNQIRDSRR